MLKKLKTDVTKKAEKENRDRQITEKLAEKELEYLKLTVVKLEVKQIAESWVQVYSRKPCDRKSK